MKDWLKLAYEADLERYPNCDLLSRRWFYRALLKKEFRGMAEILEIAKYRDYVKLTKIKRVVNEVKIYTKLLGLLPKEVNILDIGCGIGIYNSVPLANLGYQVHAIDLNEENHVRGKR